MNNYKETIGPGLIRNVDILIALLLFLIAGSGLKWGLPSTHRTMLYAKDVDRLIGNSQERLFITGPLQSYQVDECSTLLPLARMDPRRFDFDPGWFHWGSLYLYFVGGALGLLSLPGIVTLTSDRLFYLNHPEELANIYLTARLVTWIFGFGCVVIFLKLIRHRSSSIIYRSLFGILFVATPLFVLYSQYATPDVTMLFWFMLALHAAGDRHRPPSRRMLFLSFAAAGLAASTKYYGILAIGFPLWSTVRSKDYSLTMKGLLVSIGGFLIGTPYAVINWRVFFHDVAWQLNHVNVGHGDVFLGTKPSLFHHLFETFPAGLSPFTTLFIVITFFLGILLFRRIATPAVLLVIVALWIQLSRSPLKFSRYALPLIPLHLILGFEVLYAIRLRKILHVFLITLISLGIIGEIVSSTRHVRILRAPDIRDRAGEWFAANAEPGDTILLPGIPYFATPPLRSDRFDIVVADIGYKSIRNIDPEWIVISDYDAEPWIRAPEIRKEEAEIFRDLTSGLPLPGGMRRYTAHEFRAWTWPGGIAGFESMLPHDLRYHCPTIWIFRREDSE